jgi:hypothetical protein
MSQPNLFLDTQWVTNESLRILINSLEVGQFFNTDYNKEFKKAFPVGATVQVKKPQRFLVRDGLGYTPQPINRVSTTVSMDQIFGIDFEWDDYEQAVKLERGEDAIKREYIIPAMKQIAQEIDSRCANWAYKNTNNIVGVLGTNPTTSTIAGAARRRMIENACPPGDKGMIVSPGLENAVIDGSTTIFNPSSEISRQYREGSIGKARGFDWYESMSLYSHTAGSWQGTVEVYGANQSGSSLIITSTAGDTLKNGDVFNIVGVYNVNPATRRSTGVLKQFVYTGPDVTLTGGAGGDTISISPAIVGPGSQYQNVDALPADGADMTLFPGTVNPNGLSGTQGLALHRDAFALVGVELESPKAVEMCKQTRDPDTGLSVRFIKAFDPVQSRMIHRFDVLLGFGNLYNDECAVRVLGA